MQRLLVLFTFIFMLGAIGCGGSTSSTDGTGADSFVPPGEKDDYYLFYSGGHSGQVFVAGLPSMRRIQTIPVFTPSPGHGYGYDAKSKEMLGEYNWGDVHHPGLSQTNGTYDGRWLFVNDNANNRVARIDLRDFKTKQILGPIPNSMGNHGSSFVTPNTDYLLVATRFSVPLPKGEYAPVEEYAARFSGIVSGVAVDQETGEMSVGWQILTPPFNWDLGSTGKGPSDGWAFWTSYNTEMAHDSLEINASQRDRDYAAFVNWERAAEAVENGNYETQNGVPMIDPSTVEGVMYFVPVGKSPHGIDVDPSGRWVVASGKLQPTTTVFDFEKVLTAIENEDFQDTFRGVPVLNYDSILEGEVPVGQGPLHTQYDGNGHGYTSLFIESSVAKWQLPPWTDEQKEDLSQVVLDKENVHYNIGHLVIGGSDTREPYGNWLVAMNKLSRNRHISVGPSHPETSQLIDITGEQMHMVAEAYTDPEPHFAQILRADAIDPISVYPQEENDHSEAVWDSEDTGIERNGNEVTVHMTAKRSQFTPDLIEVQQGDHVTIHLTSVEQSSDMIHGFGLAEHNMNVIVDPGETKTLEFTADKTGVFPFYCTNFCSALHQEMQGYLAVRPQ
jgi:nitrous-oxide reductase